MNTTSRSIAAVLILLLMGAGVVTLFILMRSPSGGGVRAPLALSRPAGTGPGAASPEEAKQYSREGQRLIYQKQFAGALEQYRLASQSDPAHHWYRYMIASLLAYAGDSAAHDAHCRQMLTDFEEARQAYIVERLVRSSLLLPRQAEEVERARRMIDRVMEGPVAESQLPWVKMCKGIVEYRLGRYEQCIAYLAATRDDETLNYLQGRAAAGLFIAMAEARMGNMEKARKLAAEAEEKLAEGMPSSTSGSVVGNVDVWLMLQVVRREGEEVMGKTRQ